MAFDPHANFGYSTIATAPAPALTGLSLTVAAGQGALFPAAPFNCTVWPSGVAPISSNAEIIRVTVVAGDTFTIVRAQEGSAAVAIAAGYQISNSISVKVITDLENAITALPTFAVQSISAGAAAATGPMVVFSNSNSITFGVVGNTVTASFSGGGGGAAISAGTQSQSTGTIIFSNSNGITFGLDAGTLTASHNGVTSQTLQSIVLSATNGGITNTKFLFAGSGNITVATTVGPVLLFSVSSPAQSTQPVAASATNGSFLFSTIGFSNANGVTFGTSAGGIITASVAAGGAAGSVSAGTTSVALGQVVFSNSNNLTFGLNGSTITASATVASTQGSILLSAGTTSNSGSQFVFSNAGNVSFGINGSTITATATVTQSNQQITAGNGGFTFQTLSFSNANGVSFGTSAGSAITASVTVASSQGSINFSAGTTSNNLSALTFNNANGVTFGLNGSTLTASVAAGAAAGSISAGTTSVALGQVVFSNSNNLTFGLNGSTLTASATVASTQGSIILSAGTTSNSGSNFVFSNSNNITFGLNGSTITASATVASTQGSVVFGAVGSTNTGSQMIFSNSNNVSFGVNGSTITATASQSNQQMTMFGTGNTTGSSSGTTNASSVIFRGSGAVTVAITNGSIVFDAPSAAAGNVTFSAGANSAGLGSIVFSNSNRVSFGLNGSTITAQHALNFSAGGASTDIPDQIVFSNANGVSFGLAGSTITASAGGGAAGATLSVWENFPIQSTANSSLSQNFIYLDKMNLPVNISFTGIWQPMFVNVIASTSAAAASGTMGHTMQFMVYSRSVTNPAATNFSLSNNLVSMFSNQVTFSGAVSATSSSISWNQGWQTDSTGGSASVSLASTGVFQNPIYTGSKVIPIFHKTSLAAGEYWLAFRQSSSTAGFAPASSLMRFSHIVAPVMTNGSFGLGFGNSNSASVLPIPGVGIYSVSSSAFPTSMAFSDMSNQSVNRRWYVFNA